jgi:hypothetical protein
MPWRIITSECSLVDHFCRITLHDSGGFISPGADVGLCHKGAFSNPLCYPYETSISQCNRTGSNTETNDPHDAAAICLHAARATNHREKTSSLPPQIMKPSAVLCASKYTFSILYAP